MAGIHTELTFEEAIEASLVENGGYAKGASKDFDAQFGLFPSYIISFLKDTQPKQWEKLANIHKEHLEEKVVQRIVRELDLRGCLDVCRNGFTDYGVKFKMAYFKPETSLNEDDGRLYNKNDIEQLTYGMNCRTADQGFGRRTAFLTSSESSCT